LITLAPGLNVIIHFTSVIYECARVFVPGKPFQPSQMFVSKARGLPYRGATEVCFTRVGFGLICKQYTFLEWLATHKDYNLVQTFVNYGRKRFYNIGPWSYKHFYGRNKLER
jgi:hypothetical protein